MHAVHAAIVERNYERHLVRSITNERLRDYFNACFQDIIDNYGAYPCWLCTNCLREGRGTVRWGAKPRRCPVCEADAVYEGGTFQTRASIVGTVFTEAVRNVLARGYELRLTATPGNTSTHDLESGPRVAIETKGSPGHVRLPDGTTIELDRPGMARSDTRKKAFANARQFRQQNPISAYFCIVTNTLPQDLVGYRAHDVSAIFDVTKTDRIEAMVREITEFASRNP